MAKLAPFRASTLEGVCKLIGDAASGSEITRLLGGRSIPDPGGSSMTKWKRLLLALGECQNRHGAGNHVVQIILDTMAPARFVGKQAEFEETRARLNVLLAFEGYELGDDGKLCRATAVETLPEAEARAGRLRAELTRRRVHDDVLSACRAELLKENCFHAVLEATKSVAAKIRTRTGLLTDGHRLIDDAFGLSGGGKPRLAFNALGTDSERSEHLGLMNIMKGAFSAFRNPAAHEPKADWPIDEADALDLLSTLSLIHRRLDTAR